MPVLRRMAHLLRCHVDDIERVIVAELGGPALPVEIDPETRLDAIRRKVGTQEAASVLDDVARIAGCALA